MSGIIFHALGFACLIALGAVFRSLGIIGRDAQRVLPDIMLKITLPAAIISNLNGSVIAPSDLYVVLLGVFCNVAALAVGWRYGRSREGSAFAMINLSGCNVGNFAMPFISGLLTSRAAVIASLFDVGNSLMCLGVNYALASQADKGGPFEAGKALSSMRTSMPIMVYLLMLGLCALSIEIPEAVMSPIRIAADANPCIAMITIGVSISFVRGGSMLPHIVKYCAMRLGISIAVAALFGFLPIPDLEKDVSIVLTLSPIGAVSSVYTRRLNGDVGLSACINSAYVPVSIVAMSIAITLLF